MSAGRALQVAAGPPCPGEADCVGAHVLPGDGIDQAELQHLARIDRLTRSDEPDGRLGLYQSRQTDRAAGTGHEPERDLREPPPGGTSGDAPRAAERNLQPATERCAVNGRECASHGRWRLPGGIERDDRDVALALDAERRVAHDGDPASCPASPVFATSVSTSYWATTGASWFVTQQSQRTSP